MNEIDGRLMLIEARRREFLVAREVGAGYTDRLLGDMIADKDIPWLITQVSNLRQQIESLQRRKQFITHRPDCDLPAECDCTRVGGYIPKHEGRFYPLLDANNPKRQIGQEQHDI